MMDVGIMTAEERVVLIEDYEKQIQSLVEKIVELERGDLNDWHAWFYALLNIKLYKFREKISIEAEHLLGVMPPRADFLILSEDDLLDFGLDVFKIFRKHNIIEYKNPDDALDMRVLYKVIGYGNLYISKAKEKGNIPVDQVTLSIFRRAYPEELFKELGDKVHPGNAAGIYNISCMTEFPLQIIVTKELQGEENAEFRAVSKKPDKADVVKIIEDARNQDEYYLQEQYRFFLDMISKMDNSLIQEIRRDEDMTNAWMDIFKPEIDQRIDQHDAQRDLDRACQFVKDGQMTVTYAADSVGMSPANFEAEMKKRGYEIPDKTMALA